jgi:hypothetical protein
MSHSEEFLTDIEIKNVLPKDTEIRRLNGNGLQFLAMLELSKKLTNVLFIFERNPSIELAI